MENHPTIDTYARVFNLTASESCNIDADTLLYKWSYDQFLPLETHVLFNEDRRLAVERQREVDASLNKA